MVLSYPELPADLLAGRPVQRKRICRTFSDCTTGPARKACPPAVIRWNEFYKNRPEAAVLKEIKKD